MRAHWRYILLLTGMTMAGAFLLQTLPAPSGQNPGTPLSHVASGAPENGSPVRDAAAHEYPRYVEVAAGCGPYFEGPCLNIRSGPGTQYPIVTKLRAGAVLKVSDTVTDGGRDWHKIVFDEWLRYPERVSSDWYVAADYVRAFTDASPQELPEGAETHANKRIIIDRSEQMLYAYDGVTLFMQEPISTGLELTPTPRGTFNIFRKTPTRYMQGPIPDISEKEYDLPGVPWNLYFTEQGAVIHGAYWHDHFGVPWSNGCVNLPPEKAKRLYEWADLGTLVSVQD